MARDLPTEGPDSGADAHAERADGVAEEMDREKRPLADLGIGDTRDSDADQPGGNQVFDENGQWNPLVAEGVRLSDFEETPDGIEGIWDLPEYQPWSGPDKGNESGDNEDGPPVVVTSTEGRPIDGHPPESDADKGRIPDQIVEPTGQELVEMDDGERSRADAFRKETYRVGPDGVDAVANAMRWVQERVAPPDSTGSETRAVPSHPVMREHHQGVDSGSVLMASFVVGLMAERSVGWARDELDAWRKPDDGRGY